MVELLATKAATERAAAAATPPRPRRISILGLAFDVVTRAEAVAHVMALARGGRGSLVLTPNADHVVRARRDGEFRSICEQGALVVADGASVVLASRLLGKPLPERVAGSDLMPRVALAAAATGLRYFFVGGAPGDADRARAAIAAQAGCDGCCGVDCLPLGYERDHARVDALVRRINDSDADLVFVGLGSPKQEKLMAELRARTSARVLMAVGVTFSFVAGSVRRAPAVVQCCGCEWLWRLACEPRRLWRRYAGNLLVFPRLVAVEWWRTRRGGTRRVITDEPATNRAPAPSRLPADA